MHATLSIGATVLAYLSASTLALPSSAGSQAQLARRTPNSLFPRDSWCVSWYTDHDCNDLVGTECSEDGAPARGCAALGFQDDVDIYSVNWEPAGRTLRVASDENCGSQANDFGPNEGGCQQFTQNVNPVKSFSIS